MQQFKSVYFADHPGVSAKRRSLKLAFGPDDHKIFDIVAPLSSEETRLAIGLSSFSEIKSESARAGVSLNAYCLERLRRASELECSVQLYLPEIDSRSNVFCIDPMQATFRGGIKQPLHAWYPYLEAYSPEFVDNILNSFSPNAKRVFDPFAGGGTTPLTVARRGGQGTYCELNPLLQLLVETKSDVSALQPKKRSALSRLLNSIAGNLPGELSEHVADRRLIDAYGATFGSSEFFPESTLVTVLRLRSWLDSLVCTAPEAAAVATIAVAASLVPASNLIRRGDVRFRKGLAEESLRISDITGQIGDRLRQMAADINCLDSVHERVVSR